MAKLGLLARAALGGVAGFADAKKEEFKEEGEAKRQRARDELLHGNSKELLQIRQQFEADQNSLNIAAADARSEREIGAADNRLGMQLDQARDLAQIASSERMSIADRQHEMQVLIREGQIAESNAARAERMLNASYRAEQAKSQADYQKAMLEYRASADAAKEARDNSQNEAEKAHWKRVEDQQERAFEQARMQHEERMGANKQRSSEVANVDFQDDFAMVVFKDGTSKEIARGGRGPAGITVEDAYEAARRQARPGIRGLLPGTQGKDDAWIEKRAREIYSGKIGGDAGGAGTGSQEQPDENDPLGLFN